MFANRPARGLVFVTLAVVLCASGCPSDDETPDNGGAADGGAGGSGSGGSGSGSGSDIAQSAGVDEKTAASDLTEEQAGKLCEAGSAALSRELSCTTDAVETSKDQAACETKKAACLSQEATGGCSDNVAEDLSECTDITIGEIGECMDEIVAWMKTLSCDKLGEAEARPSCQATIHASCPTLFGSRDGDGGGEAGQGGGEAGQGGGEAGQGGGGDVFVCYNETTTYCQTSTVGKSGIDNREMSCTAAGGKGVDACPTEACVGVCKTQFDGAEYGSYAYAGTAADQKASCEAQGGTFQEGC
jgi:hypothetical protein